MRPWSFTLLLVVVALAGVCVAGCEQDVTHALLMDVRSRVRITTLNVRVKQYFSDGRTTVYRDFETEIPQSWDGYLVSVRGEPLFLNIEVEEPGAYAVHIAGEAVGLSAVTTVCREIEGVVVLDHDVILGRLPPELDTDGDTFPEELEPFCALMASDGFSCDTSCNVPEYLAMIDCNPDSEIEVPPGCADYGPPEDWSPFANDPCGDCHDQDCYAGDALCADSDDDGFSDDHDCDDDNPDINPGAVEICGNGVDENCAVDIAECPHGDLPCDDDEDGFRAVDGEVEGCGSDCDDGDPDINPYAFEGCGSDPSNPGSCPGCPPNASPAVDDDCDGDADEECFSDDLDGDGLRQDLDCNDCDASVGPGFPEVCGNGVDEDCDGSDLVCSADDHDRDGLLPEPEGTDCDDNDEHTYPGAPDYCDDGVAQDCVLDRLCSEVTDEDGDHFGASEGDCDDAVAEVNPWEEEICDPVGIDEDCDGQVNEVPPGRSETMGCELSLTTGSWSEIDYDEERSHCGECRHRCCAPPCTCEGDTCEEGICRCYGDSGCRGDATDYCCPDGCTDLTEDPENCGACGRRCLPTEECLTTGACGQGQCTCASEPDGAACPPGEGSTCCPVTGCTNVNSDPRNCGECGNDCTDELGGRPQGNICVVVEDSPRCYCGAVGVVCTGRRWCTEVTHPDDPCGCKNLDADESNCGRCGNRCPENEECIDGVCLCVTEGRSCDGGQNCCPGLGCVPGSCGCEDPELMHCGGYCNCPVTNICCDGECLEGTCCDGGDCPGVANPDCHETEYYCYCEAQERGCHPDHNCCDNDGCRKNECI